MRAQHKGFTLIELVVVITILGILAAVALPKFVDVQSDAREAALDGVVSSIHGAASLAYAKAMIEGVEADANSTVPVQGTDIPVAFGYPTVAGLASAMTIDGGVVYDSSSTPGVFSFSSFSGTGCTVEYTAATASNDPYSLNIDRNC